MGGGRGGGDWCIDRSVDLLDGTFTHWLVGSLIGWLVGRSTGRLVGCLTNVYALVRWFVDKVGWFGLV